MDIFLILSAFQIKTFQIKFCFVECEIWVKDKKNLNFRLNNSLHYSKKGSLIFIPVQ